MSSSTIYRLSGVSLVIGGLLAAIGAVGQGFFPNFFSPGWLLMSASVGIGLLFILLGLPAVYARQMKKAGMLGLIGFIVFFIACMQYGGSRGLTDLVVLPWVTQLNALNNPTLSFILFYIIVKLLLLVGSIVFAIATLRAGVFPKGSVILLIVGSVLFIFGGRVHVIPYLDYFGEMLFSLSFVWFGSALLSQPRQEEEFQPAHAPIGTKARA